MGSSISHFDIILDDPEPDPDDVSSGRPPPPPQQQQQHHNELLPILAGSTIRGKVQFQLTSPIIVPPRCPSSSSTTTSTTTTNTNDLRTKQQQQQEYNHHPILQLRMYGKEKVRINSSKAQRIHSATSHPNSTITATKTSSSSSNVAEREFLSIPIQWDTFPIDNTNQNYNHENNKKKNNKTKTMIPVGTYSFPFQIKLPNSLPSSTYHPKNEPHRSRSNMKFRIQYKIMATIHLPSTKSNYMISSSSRSQPPISKPNYSTVRYLWIAAVSDPRRIPHEPVPCMVQPIAMELRNPLFFQKGIFMFGASIENTQLFRHPTNHNKDAPMMALHVSCRNDSSIHIQKVQISMIEKLVWNTVPTTSVDTQTGTVTTTSVALQQVQHLPIVVIDNVQLPGLFKESKGMIKSMMEGMFGTAKQNLQRQVYNDLISGENLIPITIPSSINCHNPLADVSIHGKNRNHNKNIQLRNTMLRESYQGQLIQISHYVKIVFHTGTFCPTPTLEIPIQILPNPVNDDDVRTANHRHCASSSSGTEATSLTSTSAGVATYQPPPPTTKSKIPSQLPPNAVSTSATTTLTSSSSTPGMVRPTTTTMATTTNPAVEDTTVSSSTNTDFIPMATAVILPTSSTNQHHHQYEANEATSDVIVLGGDAILQQQQPSSRRGFFHRRRPAVQSSRTTISSNYGTNSIDTSTVSTKLSNLVPLSAPSTQLENTISIPALLSSMRSSMLDNYEYIQGKLCEPIWIELFHNMSSYEYGSIIANVHEFDQPRVAFLLAPFINHQHGGCNCEYAASAIRHTSDNHRAITAQKLIPLCVDLHTNHTTILDELNGWEQTITESAFTEAMRS
jgi:Arrestin (or S-antigen), N-terminal domain